MVLFVSDHVLAPILPGKCNEKKAGLDLNGVIVTK